ncbi:MAG: GNAT family N-acetyltransferase [Caldilinea sp.]|jgi:phosphinothricin acetyltransferase|nr:GNAT family N-acetyltransferase [Caldilinea sp.]
MEIEIDAMQPADWPQVRAIYLEGIATGQATFEQDATDWATWDRKHLSICRLVARHGEEIIGWAALTPYSARAVYAGVAEVSIYIAAAHRGRGVGRRLLEALVTASEAAGIWTLQAGIFPENRASVSLHERSGFRIIGRRERIGKLHGVWRDVLLLERRSAKVGL